MPWNRTMPTRDRPVVFLATSPPPSSGCSSGMLVSLSRLMRFYPRSCFWYKFITFTSLDAYSSVYTRSLWLRFTIGSAHLLSVVSLPCSSKSIF
jgi:hypothetical protein